MPVADHREGLQFILDVAARYPTTRGGPGEFYGFGHRVVHGGEVFREPVIIDDEVVRRIKDLIPLAPLHNPSNLAAIEVLRALRPDVPNVAVFDTAFHQSMPPKAFHYALPRKLYRMHHVRRYGFHGSSHQYVAKEASSYLGIPEERLNLITLHLGNGASAAALLGGKSIDISMGLTPLEGLSMGTRCGESCEGLTALGISVDDRRNSEASSGIVEMQSDDNQVKILVIPTDEEREIARQTIDTIRRARIEEGAPKL